jgi:hypothetical protein
MTTTEEQGGFAEIETADLGLALLIAEDEEGHYEPVAAVVSITEAREIAASNMRAKQNRLEAGEDPGLCPYEYKVWASGIDGGYGVVGMIDVLSADLIYEVKTP